ncbi:MAG: CDC48 family AAA ATPase [Candidatus Diapherotrites archaeon]|nr:CDC48 family AAA ATPase [Candidatus Diapherotrites archaeon]
MAEKEIHLKVQDSDPMHVGRNIVTLDRVSKTALGVTSGDIAEIRGPARSTAAVIWPSRSEDEGKGIVRMDSFIRHNSGVGLGDTVVVRRADYKDARDVVLAPTQEIRIIASGYNRILKKSFLGRPIVQGDNVWISVFGSGFVYRVVSTKPKGIVKVTDFTNFVLKEKPVKEGIEGIPTIAYEDIGGLKEQVQKVREMVELPMKHPELFRKLGIVPPKGILLFGPPGTGKTLMAKAVASETNAHFISVNAPEVMSKFVGEAEERLRGMFKEAEENAPSIIFIDEIDAIAPKRDEVVGEVERRVVAQLLALMDGLEARGNVIVMAATNRVNSLDEALRRPGRFDREIEFAIPDRKERKEILLIHTRGMPLAKDVDLDALANITHGFVGADLEALCKESAMKSLRRYLPEIDLEAEEIPQEVLEKLEINKKDFAEGLKDVQPSALREVSVQVPKVKWKDIGGLDDQKEELMQAVEWPLKYPDSFTEMGIKPPKGILLYGPPGCGKTLIAKAVATESEANFISIKGPELLSMWVGESERSVRKIFRKARQAAPVIVFFDEIDSIAGSRGKDNDSGVGNRVLDQILTELDGLEILKNVVFMAATNRPDLVDKALMRPGRIDKMIEIKAPTLKAREQIFKVHTENVPMAKDISLKKLAEQTDGFSGADIEGIVREAAMAALKENKMKKSEVKQSHFDKVLAKLKPSISPKVQKSYDEFKEHVADFVPSYVG